MSGAGEHAAEGIAPLDERARALAPGLGYAGPRMAAPLVIGLAMAIGMQLFLVGVIGPFYTNVLTNIGINVILAVSLNLVNGFTGQFSIGHAGFMAVGGYVGGSLTYYLSIRWFGDAHAIPIFLGKGDQLFVFSCLVGGLAAAGCGYLVGLPSLRLKGDYLAIVTLGFGEILRVILQRTGDQLSPAEAQKVSLLHALPRVGGSLGLTGLPAYTTIFWVYAFVTITLVVAYRLKESSHGRAFLSIRENEIAAQSMGIDTTKYKVRAFVLAAFFAGIAGSLYAHLIQSLTPSELGFQKSFDIIIMVVLGGMGSVSGAVLAAIILTILPEALRGFADYRMIVYALSLILMMILRPQGLFGIHEVWELARVRRQSRSKGKSAAKTSPKGEPR